MKITSLSTRQLPAEIKNMNNQGTAAIIRLLLHQVKCTNQLTTIFERFSSDNPFHATGLFLYPLKIVENQRFSDVFQGIYRENNGMKWANQAVIF